MILRYTKFEENRCGDKVHIHTRYKVGESIALCEVEGEVLRSKNKIFTPNLGFGEKL